MHYFNSSFDTILSAYIEGVYASVASIADVNTAQSLKSGYGSFVPILKRKIASDAEIFFRASKDMAQYGASEDELRQYMADSCYRTAKMAIDEYTFVIA